MPEHDPFAAMTQAIVGLLDTLGEQHPRAVEVLTLQSRWLENANRTQIEGDTEQRRADRAQIGQALNVLALETLGRPFLVPGTLAPVLSLPLDDIPDIAALPNIYTTKSEIDQIWQELLIGATSSVQIFAGDVSWIDRDKELIARIKDRVDVFVLCRCPHNEKTQQNVVDLLKAGAKVRYFDAPVRGLLIDTKDTRRSTALIIDKSPRQIISVSNQDSMPLANDRGSGVPGSSNIYRYKATRHLPQEDNRYIEVLSLLFNLCWDVSVDGVILCPIELNRYQIVQTLRTVPHYENLEENDIQIEVLVFNELLSSCIYVKQNKIRSIEAVLEAYNRQGIPPLSFCTCISYSGQSLLLPPIIEKHNGKYVIIDGTHRLFYMYAFAEKQEILCLIVSTNVPLPSSPIPLGKVQIWPRKLPKHQVFLDYKPELLRKIKVLDRALKGNYHELIGKTFNE
jgi:hypothetical protein